MKQKSLIVVESPSKARTIEQYLESEFEVVLKIAKEDVKKKMNKALGREEKILENQ